MASDDSGWVGRTLIDRYEVRGHVGSGGMSTVYRALDLQLGRSVALKIFTTGEAQNDERRRSEVDMLARLNHPNLVTMYDAHLASGDAGVPSFLVMELVDGPDLRTTLDHGPLRGAVAAQIMTDIAGALAAVHAQGIVHRDLKPANILLAPTGLPSPTHRAKLADFGIAHLVGADRMTAAGTIIGTASYLSPEQAAGANPGPESDVYALGLVVLEGLTGRREYSGSVVEAMSARASRDPQIDDDLPASWVGLLGEMTAREPAARPSAFDVAVRAGDIAGDLEVWETAARAGEAAGVGSADGLAGAGSALAAGSAPSAVSAPAAGSADGTATVAMPVAGIDAATVALTVSPDAQPVTGDAPTVAFASGSGFDAESSGSAEARPDSPATPTAPTVILGAAVGGAAGASAPGGLAMGQSAGGAAAASGAAAGGSRVGGAGAGEYGARGAGAGGGRSKRGRNIGLVAVGVVILLVGAVWFGGTLLSAPPASDPAAPLPVPATSVAPGATVGPAGADPAATSAPDNTADTGNPPAPAPSASSAPAAPAAPAQPTPKPTATPKPSATPSAPPAPSPTPEPTEPQPNPTQTGSNNSNSNSGHTTG